MQTLTKQEINKILLRSGIRVRLDGYYSLNGSQLAYLKELRKLSKWKASAAKKDSANKQFYDYLSR